jgi:hypothetical protein
VAAASFFGGALSLSDFCCWELGGAFTIGRAALPQMQLDTRQLRDKGKALGVVLVGDDRTAEA